MPKSTVVMAERAGFEPATELWALCRACDGLVRVTFDHGATSPPHCGKVGARPEKNNHLNPGIDWRKRHEREDRLPLGSGRHAPARLSLAPSQPGVHPARGDQVLQVVDPLESWPLAVLEHQTGAPVGGVEFFRAPPRVPLRLELGQEALDLAEVHPI